LKTNTLFLKLSIYLFDCLLLLLALTLNIGCSEDESANGLHKVTYREEFCSSIEYTDPTNNQKVTKSFTKIGWSISFENIEGQKILSIATTGSFTSNPGKPKVFILVDDTEVASGSGTITYFLP
jgi:hypothetical protein